MALHDTPTPNGHGMRAIVLSRDPVLALDLELLLQAQRFAPHAVLPNGAEPLHWDDITDSSVVIIDMERIEDYPSPLFESLRRAGVPTVILSSRTLEELGMTSPVLAWHSKPLIADEILPTLARVRSAWQRFAQKAAV